MPSRQPISYRDGIVVLGSCFAENIGMWLAKSCMNVCDNPFGVLYNPLSIASALQILMSSDDTALGDDRLLTAPDGLWYSYDFHGSYCAMTKHELKQKLAATVTEARKALAEARHLIVTFGTAWVYEREGSVVANCHKMPAKTFARRRLTADEIVAMWTKLIEALGEEKHLLFTVSPIRHVKDTLHGNQLSKATLLLAIDQLCARFPERVEYVPAYELLVDDLRDYRFYADDLVHPSPLAVEIVKHYFAEHFLDKECQTYMSEVEPLVKASQHKPLHPDSEAHEAFKCQINLKIDQLIEKYSNFGLSILKV